MGSLSTAEIESENVPPPGKEVASPRLKGMDSIRFFMALWVALYHIPFSAVLKDQEVSKSMVQLLLFNGQAAVLVFFVISGFCIHYPYRNGKLPPFLPYLVRREVRLLPPLILAFAFSYLAKGHGFLGMIGWWSLVCEEIYYVIYPILLKLRERIGWDLLIGLSLIPPILLALKYPQYHTLWAFGVKFTWLFGLPCWMMGCRLAQLADGMRKDVVSVVMVWAWRVGLFALSSAIVYLRFNSSLTPQYTLVPFGLLSALWLKVELVHRLKVPANDTFEKLGLASYSIYLVHLPAFFLLMRLGLGALPDFVRYLAVMSLVLGFCWAFSRLFEMPFHRLARTISRKMEPATSR